MNIEFTKREADLLLEALQRYDDEVSCGYEDRSDFLVALTNKVEDEIDEGFPTIETFLKGRG